MLCWKRLLRELNMDILFVVWGITRISFEDYFFVMLYCDSWPLKNRTWSGSFPLDLSDVRCISRKLWFLPLFYEDRFIIIILWLGLFPYILINVFFLICFCSVYVIGLFGQCSRVLDPALDTGPLNWDIISFTVNFHFVSWSCTACLE